MHRSTMHLSLRAKLFLAFFSAVLGPVVALAALALLYASDLRRERTARFEREARVAFAQRSSEVEVQVARFAERVKREAQRVVCADTDCYRRLHRALSEPLPGAPGVADMVVRSHGQVSFSTLEPSAKLPSVSPLMVSDDGPPRDLDLAQLPRLPGLPNLKELLDTDGIHSIREIDWIGSLDGEPTWLRVSLDDQSDLFATMADAPLLFSESSLSDHLTAFVGDGITPRLDGPFADLAAPDLLTRLPQHGAHGIVTGAHGTRYLVQVATSGENPAFRPLDRKTELFAAVPEATLMAPINRLGYAALASVAVFLGIALTFALVMSRRMLSVIGRLRLSLRALGRGEPARLERLSQDELGGELVEAVNRLAQQLSERSKREELENWRRAIRVLSHEINNTIAPLRSVTSTLREELSERARSNDDLHRAAELMGDRVEALHQFVRRFGELARLPPPVLSRTNLAHVVAHAARIFTEEATERRIGLELDASDLEADVDAGQMERVVINLVKNGLEASAPGQTVTVRLRQVASHAHLEVEDHGAGISPEAKSNLFVPSYSTKPGGSGIGLALAQQIVVGHRGWISAEDSPRGGALFRVVIPLDSRP